MKKFLWTTLVILVGSLISMSCIQRSSPPPTEVRGTETRGTATTRLDWEQEWQIVLAEGKKEGSVVVSTTWPPETRTALTQALKDKYGIALESSPQARGAELVPKIQAEQRAGLYLTDFFGGGSTTALNLLKPVGLLGSLESLLILPEVKDPKYWMGGQFPFLDRDKQFIAMLAQKQPYISYNNDLIKKGEITTYKDLLKPQYKGKITLNDPSTSGSGAAMMTHLAYDLWSVEEAREFLRQLIKQQEVVIQRDNRLHAESVARGKFAIGLGGRLEDIGDLMNMGAPMDVVVVKEGTNVSPAAGGISAPTKLAHPNAARVFLNWLLTKEGLALFARTFGGVSMRTDVSTEGIHPLFLFQPGEKLFMHSEEKSLNMGKMMEVGKQVMQETSK